MKNKARQAKVCKWRRFDCRRPNGKEFLSSKAAKVVAVAMAAEVEAATKGEGEGRLGIILALLLLLLRLNQTLLAPAFSNLIGRAQTCALLPAAMKVASEGNW